MSTENSLGRLRPGAWKIIHDLIKGPKSFSELRDATGLSHTALANYLRELSPLLMKDLETKKYRLFWKPPTKDTDYAFWESTDLKDVQRATRSVDTIMDAKIDANLKYELLGRFLDAAFGFLTGNILLNFSEAVERESIEDFLADVGRLMDGYVAPYIGFLAMYCWEHGPSISEWLKLIGSDIAHEARHKFDPKTVTEPT